MNILWHDTSDSREHFNNPLLTRLVLDWCADRSYHFVDLFIEFGDDHDTFTSTQEREKA